MSENTSLSVLENNNFELMPISDEIKDIIAEEMDGLGSVPFDVIKIPSGGGIAFETPGETEDAPVLKQELIGIIVDHHPVNALWLNKYDGSNNPPDCSSFDGKTGVNAAGNMTFCDACPYNKFGSDPDGGKGKACKNMHRIYILMSGQAIPMLLILPPSSISAWRNYVGKKVVIKGKRVYQVLTKITLKKEKNDNGIVYSEAVFSKVADLTSDECAMIKPMVDTFKQMTRSASMQSKETLAGSGEFVEVSDAELPF